mmetsp:Transcript_11696/g.21093  ORF Transcript_11696/g.21093 Transcript_11696/m.21093 type:complete len:214 (-) Transcript_11696:2743-3384(-)
MQGAAAPGAQTARQPRRTRAKLGNIRLDRALRRERVPTARRFRLTLKPRLVAHRVPLQPHHLQVVAVGLGRDAGVTALRRALVRRARHGDGREGMEGQKSGLEWRVWDAVDGIPGDSVPRVRVHVLQLHMLHQRAVPLGGVLQPHPPRQQVDLLRQRQTVFRRRHLDVLKRQLHLGRPALHVRGENLPGLIVAGALCAISSEKADGGDKRDVI